jgi:four helix bundle protein
MDEYVHLVYKLTRTFPREELYGVTSQLRRSALSVILNYIEGYARCRDKVHKNFLETSYASLKESKYLSHFSLVENYLSQRDYKEVIQSADEIGTMLWSTMTKL